MRCPTCDDVTLVISSREGIEIDHCPECRGVWLDRGELDKIIERAAPSIVGAAPAAPAQERPRDDRDRYRDDDRDRYRDDRYRDDRDRYRSDDRYRYDKKKKKRSFLEDIFDFD
jgi:Zn-finger nucleic acid-binding protein